MPRAVFGTERWSMTFGVDDTPPALTVPVPDNIGIGDELTLAGTVNERVELTAEGEPVEVDEDGAFEVDLLRPAGGHGGLHRRGPGGQQDHAERADHGGARVDPGRPPDPRRLGGRGRAGQRVGPARRRPDRHDRAGREGRVRGRALRLGPGPGGRRRRGRRALRPAGRHRHHPRPRRPGDRPAGHVPRPAAGPLGVGERPSGLGAAGHRGRPRGRSTATARAARRPRTPSRSAAASPTSPPSRCGTTTSPSPRRWRGWAPTTSCSTTCGGPPATRRT